VGLGSDLGEMLGVETEGDDYDGSEEEEEDKESEAMEDFTDINEVSSSQCSKEGVHY